MLAESIKDQIVKLSRKEQAEIVHFIMDILISQEEFSLSPKLKEEIDNSYKAIESGEDKGYSHASYRAEMEQFLSKKSKG